MRRTAILILVAALAGCTSSPPPSPPSPSGRAALGNAPQTVDEAFFQTPSGNVYCVLNRALARCDIIRRTWLPPAKPAGCDFDWGNGAYVEAGTAGMTCASDTLIGSARQTLEYGESLRAGPLRCDSQSTGVTCSSVQTSHGFTLASAQYALF